MALNRRELILTLLCAPAVLTAGCWAKPRLPPVGELLGQSWEIGHRLREAIRPRPIPEQWQNVGVVIVGAGIAGLSAAWRLMRGGCQDFVILELESEPGGTARSG